MAAAAAAGAGEPAGEDAPAAAEIAPPAGMDAGCMEAAAAALPSQAMRPTSAHRRGAAVLALSVCPDAPRLASVGDDGRLCLWELASPAEAHPAAEVRAAAPQPASHGTAGVAGAATGPDQPSAPAGAAADAAASPLPPSFPRLLHVLAAGKCAAALASDAQSVASRLAEDCGSESDSDIDGEEVLVACSRSVLQIDLRTMESPGQLRVREVPAGSAHAYSVNSDDINQLAVNDKGSFAAAADDSGEIKILDLRRRSVCKTLRRAHTSLCVTLAFRPRTAWEIVSGGLDQSIVHWDHSSGRALQILSVARLCAAWDAEAAAEEERAAAAEETQGGGEGGEAAPVPPPLAASSASSSQLFNPPLVHRVCIDRSGRLLLAALGSGSALVFAFGRRGEPLRPVYRLLGVHTTGLAQAVFLYPPLPATGPDAAGSASDSSGAGELSLHVATAGNDRRLVVWALPQAPSAAAVPSSDSASAFPGAGGQDSGPASIPTPGGSRSRGGKGKGKGTKGKNSKSSKGKGRPQAAAGGAGGKVAEGPAPRGYALPDAVESGRPLATYALPRKVNWIESPLPSSPSPPNSSSHTLYIADVAHAVRVAHIPSSTHE